MRTCPSCGRFITDASTQVCPNCGVTLAADTAATQQNEPAAPAYGAPPTQPPYAPYGQYSQYSQYGQMQAPTQPSYPTYGSGYGPGYDQPQPPAQPPYGPGYGQPGQPSQYGPYGQYGQPGQPSQYGQPARPSMPLPPAQPPYGPAYGAQPGYPGAYRPGVDWKPGEGSTPRPWGRIFGGIAAFLVVVAIVVSIYNQTHVKPLSAAQVAATATASNALLADAMTSNTNGWASDSHCYFDHDGYHIVDGYICYAPIGDQIDGTESVTVKQLSGPTIYSYGLVFRRVSKGNYYFFGVDSNSKWVFTKVVNDKPTRLQEFTTNAAINGGLNTKNTLSVTMAGSAFDCYVNGVNVGTIHDSTFPEGMWGLAGGDSINVVFADYLARK